MVFALAALLLLAPSVQAPETAPDTVRLKGGKSWTGVLLRAGTTEIEFLDEKGELQLFPRKKVQTLSGPRAEYAEYLERLQRAYSDRGGVEEAFAFATWCRARGYARDAELAWWRTLALDPTHSGAHQALGHRAQGEIWIAPLEDDKIAAWPDLLRLRAQAEHPWRFTTMHFNVEVSGPLDRAVIAAAAAEFLYAKLYALFQERGTWWDLRQPILVRIWSARNAGYPGLDPRSTGHWDRSTHTLHTWFAAEESALRPVRYEALLAEAVLSSACEELSRSAPDLPAWLLVGSGRLLEAGTLWGSGLPSCDPERAARSFVELHAGLEPMASASAVAVAARAEFTGPRADAWQAQAYTLLHFLCFPQAPEWEAGFTLFLQEAVRNRGGGSAFRTAFGEQVPALDAAWQAWVRREGAARAGAR